MTLASLAGYTSLDGNGEVGFMLPLFAVEGQRWFAQEVDDATGLVRSFYPTEAIDITMAPQPLSVHVGTPPVYVFLDERGVHIGPLTNITPHLREFVQNNPRLVGILLQIAELIGTPAERQSVRARVASAIARNSGNAASLIFRKTSLESAFIVRIQRAFRLEHGSERLKAIRKDFTIGLNAQGDLEAGNVELQDDQEVASLATILSELSSEFSNRPTGQGGFIFAEATIQGQADVRQDNSLARPFFAKSRQEERVALLLKDLLDEPEKALERIEDGYPRAGFEVRARDIIRGALASSSTPLMSLPAKHDPLIAGLIPQLWKACHPFNRGHLFYFLSLHLARYPAIRLEIRKRLARSHSAALERHRTAIEVNLSRHENP